MYQNEGKGKVWLHAGDLVETLLHLSEIREGGAGEGGNTVHADVVSRTRNQASRNLRTIVDFARQSRLPGSCADYARALTVLKSDSQYAVTASLHVAPSIDRLPTIQRTGISTPTMDGLQLGFDSDRVDNRNHQRCGSLYFTKAARFQALTDLLIDFLTLWQASAMPGHPLRARSMLGEEAARALDDNLNGLLGASSDEEREQCALRILKDPALARKLMDVLADALQMPRTRAVGSELTDAQKNALSALYLQYQEILDSQRHLGKGRLDRWRTERISNLVIQGAGDLSMNQWNVAFYRDPEGRPGILIPANEPFGSRHYYCLLGLKPELSPGLSDYFSNANCRVGNLAILPLRFSPGAVAMADPKAAFDMKNELTFALYGKLILRDGCVVDPVEVVDEFLDLRHIFDLPNLNLDDKIRLRRAFNQLKARAQLDPSSCDRMWDSMKDKPRSLFGQMQSDDVWLLENVLLDDQNLRRLACLSSIAIPLNLLGAPKDWVTVCLRSWGYELEPRPEDVRQGGFSWDLKDIARPVLRVHLKWAKYPCTMLGLGSVEKGPGESPDCAYLLAWGHDFKHGRHTIQDCANVLRAAGARWALAIDEGQDVFQFFARDQGALERFTALETECGDLSEFFRVPLAFNPAPKLEHQILKRTSLRASIAFWQEKIA